VCGSVRHAVVTNADQDCHLIPRQCRHRRDLLRVPLGRLPRSSPDAGYLADELDPIPIDDIVVIEE
jgi:hypothetical protein